MLSVPWFTLLIALILFVLPSSALAQNKKTREWNAESSQHVQNLFYKFNDAIRAKDYPLAISLGEELCQVDDSPSDRYDLACIYLRVNRSEDAIKKLKEAIACAPNDPSFMIGTIMREDTDLDSIRSRREFKALFKQAENAQWKPIPLEYETGEGKSVTFHRSKPDNSYLTTLRTKYNLDALIAGARGDMERVKILCTWVHTRWNHVGDAQNQPTDPIGLLEAAEKGDNFRCVEYGVTVTGCLNAVGIPARVVSARAKDVETRRFGAGHVFAEAYLRDQKRWVFVDPQMNVVGEVEGKPLNTVEFRQAFSEPNPKVHYNLQLGSCFYYFEYRLDERYPMGSREQGNILLAPKGAPTPQKFQRIARTPPTLTTHNPADVYASPELGE